MSETIAHVRRAPLASLLLLAASLAPACETPPEALALRCRQHLVNPVECKLSAQLVRDHVSASVETHTKNQQVQVKGSFTVEEGHVAVVLFGCSSGARSDVKPGAPTKIDCLATQNSRTYRTGVDVYSFGGDAKGLRGELTFVPR